MYFLACYTPIIEIKFHTIGEIDVSNVPASKRKPQPLLAYVRGTEIRDKVFGIVENENYVPKRHRLLYGNSMYAHACNIVYNVISANASYPRSYSALYMRRWYQQKAIVNCVMLYEDIKTLISRSNNKSATKCLISLSNDVSSELTLIRNWRKSTKLLKGSPGNSTGSNKNLNAISAVGNKIIKKKAAKINASSNNAGGTNIISAAGNISIPAPTPAPNVGAINGAGVSDPEFVNNILNNQMNGVPNNDTNVNSSVSTVPDPNVSTNSTMMVSGFEVNNPNAISGSNGTNRNSFANTTSIAGTNSNEDRADEEDNERLTAASAILMDLMESSFDGDVLF